MEKTMDKLLKVSAKMQNNPYLTAIRNSFSTLLPISIAGAFSVLVLNVVTSTTTEGLSLAKISFLSWLENISPIFEAVNFATLGMLTLMLIVIVSLEFSDIYDKRSWLVPVVGLASYLTVVNPTMVVEVGEQQELVTGVLTQDYTGTGGVFIGMIIALISTKLFLMLNENESLKINMPESVPSNVAKAFSDMIPGILTIIIIATFSFLVFQFSGYTLFEVINVVLQKPLEGILLSFPGYLLITSLMLVLWSAGIHGDGVLGPIIDPLLLTAVMKNADMVGQGQKATDILNSSFHVVFNIGTGSGMTGALIIAIFIASRRDDYKAVSKISLTPALFNINEPMIFGLPIVFNPILIIPFILAPMASVTFGYIMTKIGIAKVLYVMVPWTTPPILKSFLASGGHIPTVLVEIGAYVIAILIYLPFVKLANKEVKMSVN